MPLILPPIAPPIPETRDLIQWLEAIHTELKRIRRNGDLLNGLAAGEPFEFDDQIPEEET